MCRPRRHFCTQILPGPDRGDDRSHPPIAGTTWQPPPAPGIGIGASPSRNRHGARSNAPGQRCRWQSGQVAGGGRVNKDSAAGHNVGCSSLCPNHMVRTRSTSDALGPPRPTTPPQTAPGARATETPVAGRPWVLNRCSRLGEGGHGDAAESSVQRSSMLSFCGKNTRVGMGPWLS